MAQVAALEGLLHEEESSTLDFKRDQYRFVGANDRDKAELLKDILAFANAWRHADAYILIGVEEVRGGPSKVVGLSQHLSDSDVQQFVNSKVNRPITFSYAAVEMNGSQVGVIHIPVQRRPFFLEKPYGPLMASTVYLRRGSSTDIASPDEIARMGQEALGSPLRSAELSAFVVAGKHDEVVDKTLNINVLDARIPEKVMFPQYRARQYIAGTSVSIPDTTSNHDYYYEYAQFFRQMNRVRGLKFAVRNSGNAVANDVKLVLKISNPSPALLVVHSDRLPHEPHKDALNSLLLNVHKAARTNDIIVKQAPSEVIIRCLLGKIQASDQSQTSDLLCVGASTSLKVALSAAIFSDDLEAPVHESLSISIDVETRDYDVADFVPQ